MGYLISGIKVAKEVKVGDTITLADNPGEAIKGFEDVKPMVLNRTNAQLVGVCTGAKTAGEARGKQIVVYNDPTISFGGKIVGGLRLKKLSGAPAQPGAAKKRDEIEDIPW